MRSVRRVAAILCLGVVTVPLALAGEWDKEGETLKNDCAKPDSIFNALKSCATFLFHDGKPVRLTVTEFLILQSLAQRPGFVKSRDNLMDAAYDDQVYVDDRTIDSHIKRLRKKFKAVDDGFDSIETLYGVGYRYKEG